MEKGKEIKNVREKESKEDTMDVMVREKLAVLRDRANQRCISFPNTKVSEEECIENKLFDEMKDQIYKQITKEE